MMRKQSIATFNTETVSSDRDSLPKDRRVSLKPASDASNRRQSVQQSQGNASTSSFSGPSGMSRPSLVGLLASKRFAKRLSKRFISMRTGSFMSSRLSEPAIYQEPTYRMEPLEKFQEAKVREIIKESLESRLKEYKYNPKVCPMMCRVLTEEIKEKVKNLNYDRYKIITLVFLGERKDQSIIVTSRCAWDDNFDDYATYSYQNDNLFCTATVYGIYNE